MREPEWLYGLLRDFPQIAARAGDQLIWRPSLTPPSLLLVRDLPPEEVRLVIRHPEGVHLLRGPEEALSAASTSPGAHPHRRRWDLPHLRLL